MTCVLVYVGVATTGVLRTENVDIDGSSRTSAGVDGFNDVGGAVASGGVSNRQLGVSWLCVDRNAVIGPQDQVSLGPLDAGIRLPFDVGRKFDFAASPGADTGQQLHIQLNLWRFWWGFSQGQPQQNSS